jgi:hypothetical protein
MEGFRWDFVTEVRKCRENVKGDESDGGDTFDMGDDGLSIDEDSLFNFIAGRIEGRISQRKTAISSEYIPTSSDITRYPPHPPPC